MNAMLTEGQIIEIFRMYPDGALLTLERLYSVLGVSAKMHPMLSNLTKLGVLESDDPSLSEAKFQLSPEYRLESNQSDASMEAIESLQCELKKLKAELNAVVDRDRLREQVAALTKELEDARGFAAARESALSQDQRADVDLTHALALSEERVAKLEANEESLKNDVDSYGQSCAKWRERGTRAERRETELIAELQASELASDMVIEGQSVELKAPKIPGTMADAPRDGKHILGFTVLAYSGHCEFYVMWWSKDNDGWWGFHRDYWTPDGWYDLPTD